MAIISILGNLKNYLMKIFAALTTSDYKLIPELSFFGTKTKVEFTGSCLKQDKVIFNHGKVVSI